MNLSENDLKKYERNKQTNPKTIIEHKKLYTQRERAKGCMHAFIQ